MAGMDALIKERLESDKRAARRTACSVNTRLHQQALAFPLLPPELFVLHVDSAIDLPLTLYQLMS